MSNTQAALVEALKQAEAGLEFAGADQMKPTGDFVPTPLLALRAVRAAIAQAEAPPKTLTDEQIDRIAENCAKSMPDGIRGFCVTWGWRQFARELLDVCAGHQREPVAEVMVREEDGEKVCDVLYFRADGLNALRVGSHFLYASPQPAEAAK